MSVLKDVQGVVVGAALEDLVVVIQNFDVQVVVVEEVVSEHMLGHYMSDW